MSLKLLLLNADYVRMSRSFAIRPNDRDTILHQIMIEAIAEHLRHTAMISNPQVTADYSIKLRAEKDGLYYAGLRKVRDVHSNALSNGRSSDLYRQVSGGKLLRPKIDISNPRKLADRAKKRYFKLWRNFLLNASKNEKNPGLAYVLNLLGTSDKLIFIKEFFTQGKLKTGVDQQGKAVIDVFPSVLIRVIADQLIKHNPKLAFKLSNPSHLLGMDSIYKGFIIVRDAEKRSVFTDHAVNMISYDDEYKISGFWVYVESLLRSKTEKYFDLENIPKTKERVFVENITEKQAIIPKRNLIETLRKQAIKNQEIIDSLV
jgi:hypothetical protein